MAIRRCVPDCSPSSRPARPQCGQLLILVPLSPLPPGRSAHFRPHGVLGPSSPPTSEGPRKLPTPAQWRSNAESQGSEPVPAHEPAFPVPGGCGQRPSTSHPPNLPHRPGSHPPHPKPFANHPSHSTPSPLLHGTPRWGVRTRPWHPHLCSLPKYCAAIWARPRAPCHLGGIKPAAAAPEGPPMSAMKGSGALLLALTLLCTCGESEHIRGGRWG